MACKTTLKVDQLFVRDIIFKDYGNRPISSHQVLMTRGDGVIYFSNAPNTCNIGSFNYIQVDSTFTYAATNPVNTMYIASGQGVQFTNTSNDGINKLVLNSLAPQNLFVYDTKQNLNFSSLSNTPFGRTLNFAGSNDITLSLSTNTVIIGSVFTSSLSSIYELTSTAEALVIQTSTQIAEVSQLYSTLDLFLIITNFSTIYEQLNTFSTTLYDISTFVYTTFKDDGTGHHNHLVISTIDTLSISTINFKAQFGQVSTLLIGNNLLYDSPSVNNSTQDCAIYVSDGVVSSIADYFHIKDAYTNVDIVFEKQYLTSHSTIFGSTYTTNAQVAGQGIITALGAIPTYKPVTQQIETIRYVVDPIYYSTTLSYVIQNHVYADDICATSTLTVMAPGGTKVGDLNWSNATGNGLNLSTLCVSTIVGYSSPIFTFDKVCNRVGLNMGQVQPRATFDVSGVVFANNFVTSSDRRLKSDIQPLKGLDYLSTYSFNINGMADIGVLADEVERIAPSCIYERPDGYKAVSYQKLVPVLLSYIHDLDARLKKLEMPSTPSSPPPPTLRTVVQTSPTTKSKDKRK
jgi:hypothetical protein